MICKMHPCLKLTGMIGADLVLISHVSSSHQLDRSFHEVVTVGMLGHRSGAAMKRALLERSQFIDVMAATTQGGRAMHLLASLSRGMHAEAAVQARER